MPDLERQIVEKCRKIFSILCTIYRQPGFVAERSKFLCFKFLNKLNKIERKSFAKKSFAESLKDY